MAQYYGSISGKAATEATREGTKDSGMSAHIRGWNTGVRVELEWNDDAQCDEVFIFKTGGSNGHASDVLIARWLDDGSEVRICL